MKRFHNGTNRRAACAHRVMTLLSLMAAGLLVSVATPANASPATNEVTVSYADLDLDHPHDAGIMYRRIRQAARKVCADVGGLYGVARPERRKCRREALDAAVIALERPAVTAWHPRASTVDEVSDASVADVVR